MLIHVTYPYLSMLEIEPDFEIPEEPVTAPPIKFESAPSFVPSEDIDVNPDLAAFETITRTR